MNSTEPEERTTSELRSSQAAIEIDTSKPQLLSDAQLEELLSYLPNLVTAISIFGILCNIVNIVFYKMDFSVVTNISPLCLEIACLFV